MAQRTETLLSQHSKDIRLITWLIEAWTHLYGWKGMGSGINLSHQLLTAYWYDLHPQIEDQDLDQRLGLLQGMINQLPCLIKQIPLNQQQPNSTLLAYENLLYQLHQSRKQADESELEHLNMAIEQAEQQIAHVSLPQRQQQYQQFLEILAHWQSLKQSLEQCMQQDAPRFAQIDAMFEQMNTHLKKLYQVQHWAAPSTAPATASDTARQQDLMAAFDQRHQHPAMNTQNVAVAAHSSAQPPHAHAHPDAVLDGLAPLQRQDQALELDSATLQATATTTSPSQSLAQTISQDRLPPSAQLMFSAHEHIHNREQAIAVLKQISEYFQQNEPHSPVSYLLQKSIHWSQLSLHEWLAQVIKGEQALADVHEILGVNTDASQVNA